MGRLVKLTAYCPYEDCNCFARMADGTCYALQDTDFSKRDGVCQFYKTSDKIDPEVFVEIKKMNKAIKKMLERSMNNGDSGIMHGSKWIR